MTLTGPGTVIIDTIPPVEVTGPPAAILAWLCGRGDGDGLSPGPAALPAIPPLG